MGPAIPTKRVPGIAAGWHGRGGDDDKHQHLEARGSGGTDSKHFSQPAKV